MCERVVQRYVRTREREHDGVPSVEGVRVTIGVELLLVGFLTFERPTLYTRVRGAPGGPHARRCETAALARTATLQPVQCTQMYFFL